MDVFPMVKNQHAQISPTFKLRHSTRKKLYLLKLHFKIVNINNIMKTLHDNSTINYTIASIDQNRIKKKIRI